MFKAEQYYDNVTMRNRWAVLHTASSVWYFPERYGKAEAVALACRLNRQAA